MALARLRSFMGKLNLWCIYYGYACLVRNACRPISGQSCRGIGQWGARHFQALFYLPCVGLSFAYTVLPPSKRGKCHIAGQ